MLSRRQFLELPLAGALVGCIGDDMAGRFTCGVASGDPTQSSVVLWTRLDGETDQSVRWVVARDPELTNIVATGEEDALEEHDWCVKVVVSELDADSEYFYAFRIANEQSIVGRTRTAPTERDQLRFAVVSCASISWGYFHSYRHIAQRDDIDAVLHLGDYIYEYRSGRYGDVRGCEPATEAVTLADYRERYRQYHRDPDLRAMHAAHPMIAIWDDHEIANDAWSGGAANHDPATQGSFADRMEAALRANVEYLPVAGWDQRTCARTLSFGAMASLRMNDTRTARDEPALSFQDPSLLSPDRKMIARADEAETIAWLGDRGPRWSLLCQTTMFAQRPHDQMLSSGLWDGYPAQRERILGAIASARAAGGAVVVIGGDLHSSWANDLAPDLPAYIRDGGPVSGEGCVAVEVIATSITSKPPARAADDPQYAAIAEISPHVRFVELTQRGYVDLSLTEMDVTATFLFADNVAKVAQGEHRIGAVLISERNQPHWKR